MPWYRMAGMLVHMHGRKLPPGCQFNILLNDKREKCLAPTSRLCDFPTALGKTCSAPMCKAHALRLGEFDICPTHNARHGLFSRLLPAP